MKSNKKQWKVLGRKIIFELAYSRNLMVNRWGNSGNSDRLYFLGLQNPADGHCSHEIKRRLLLGRKVITKLDSLLKAETLFCQ